MGKKGLFVSMPSYKTNQIDENNHSVYRDICFPVTAEFRGKLNTLMTDAYEKAAAEVQEQIRGQKDRRLAMTAALWNYWSCWQITR